jgi:phosphatidylinositol alpha-1,6-mannosyltransferase
MTSPAFAAITLDQRGGGIAAVARLVWRVFQDHWPDSSLIELQPGQTGSTMDPNTVSRLRFGSRTLTTQAAARCSWILFGHVALTKAQAVIPQWSRRPHAVLLYGIDAWGPLTAAQRRMVSAARVRVAISRHTARRALDAHPGIGPITECLLGLDAAELCARDEVRSGSSPMTVLLVGRMLAAERYKGHDQVLEAWPAVTRLAPGASLVVVGDGDDAARLRQKAADLGVAGSVVFTGFVSQDRLAALYRDASLLAMPSRAEGFGLVYLEAMAQGLPCIGSTHDAAGEVIEDGVTGYLVDQADIAGLADRIAGLLTDPQRRTEMGGRGRARYLRHFTYEAYRTRLLAALRPLDAPARVPVVATVPKGDSVA